MLKRKGKEEDFEDEEKLAVCRYLLFVFNAIFFVAGALVFAVGMYVTNDNDMEDSIASLEMSFYLNATITLMFSSSLVILNAIVGACGGFLMSRRTIFVHIILTGITFVMLLVTSTYLLCNGLEQSNLYPYIQVTMRELVYEYYHSVEAKTIVDKIQEFAECCGGFGADDYIDIHSPVPDTCRNHVTGNQFSFSCGQVLSGVIEKRTGWMCGLSLCLCFLEILSLCVSFYAIKFINHLLQEM